MTAATIRILSQEEIVKGGASEPPFLRLPDPRAYFSDRAARFRGLADRGHADEAFLRLMERLAVAQQAALDVHPTTSAPEPAHLDLCRLHGLPPLGKDTPRDVIWRDALILILDSMSAGAPEPLRRTIRGLKGMDPSALDATADRVLAFDYPDLDAAAVPLVAGALQVHWVRRAAAAGPGIFSRLDVPGICPVCGSPPVGSALRIGIPAPGTRYLHCALCGTDWQTPRGQCVQCEKRDKVAYFHVEGGSEA